MHKVAPPPSFRQALGFWAKFAWISFGGPTGQMAILHEELVVRRGWIAEADFLQGLNFCLMLPGPEAQQLTAYLGWRLHGVRGALAAGILFFLPAMVLLWGLSLLYVVAGTVPAIAAAFYGLGPAVMAIIVRALLLLAKRTLQTSIDLATAGAAAVLMVLWHGNYPLIVIVAGLTGMILHRNARPASPAGPPDGIRVGPLLRTGLLCVVAWLGPLLAAWVVLGPRNIIVAEGFFFTKAALVTFGGAYVVLPYVAQHAVVQHHWLGATDMLHGVALASTLPGPLVIVTEFVAFVGAWHQPGALPPLLAATLAALLTTWVTFAPSFLYILVGGPLVNRLVRLQVLQGALRAISAAVVGVMIDFALWFGGRLLFPAPHPTRPDWFVLVVSLGALYALMRFRVSVPLLLAVGAGLGLLEHFLIR